MLGGVFAEPPEKERLWRGGFLKFLESVWAKFSTKDSPAVVGPGEAMPTPGVPAQSAQPPAQREPRAGIEGLAVRCATGLPPGVFSDRQRVKWVLLQPEVAASALRFASLAGLGEKRATEAAEARATLKGILVAELPAERPEHVEMLLDSMLAQARRLPQQPSGGPPPYSQAAGRREQLRPVGVPEVRTPSAPTYEPLQPEYSAPLAETYTPQPQPEPGPAHVAMQPVVYPTESGSVAPVEYELHVLPGTNTRDLDEELIREYIRGSTRRRTSSSLVETGVLDVMRRLKAIDGPVGRGERLTVLGGLYFARQPERLVVQSKVRFVEFPGVEVASSGEKVTYRYTEEVTGTIPELIARMERIHKERLAPGVLADGFRVEELPAVPLFALREAMVNAVCHRDYSLVGANIQVRLFADRLEVQSPGGLPGPVTVDNILTESYARNPRVADILRDLGYVERHGLGIDNMFTSMAEAHLPPPEFSNTATSFTVTLRFRLPDEVDPESWLAEVGATKLDQAHQKALVFARRTGRVVSADYQSFSGVDSAEAESRLRWMVRDGWLVQNGTGEQAYYTLGPSAGSAPDIEPDANPLPQAALDSLSASQRRILDIVVRQGKVKASEVLEISALKDRRTIQRALASLTQSGLVVRRASSATDPNASYEVNHDYCADGPDQDSQS
jgi:ATP-dependent DNA helicase RecG